MTKMIFEVDLGKLNGFRLNYSLVKLLYRKAQFLQFVADKNENSKT